MVPKSPTRALVPAVAGGPHRSTSDAKASVPLPFFAGSREWQGISHEKIWDQLGWA